MALVGVDFVTWGRGLDCGWVPNQREVVRMAAKEDVKGSGRSLFEGTIPVFVYIDCGK